jgi:hypothetical protein
MARQAHTALIIRRGPARWTELILWDTKKDRFQRGQWFHGRIYEDRCDLSPDGTKFIYFASKYGRKRDGDIPDTWTAISKSPYFTALAPWPNGTTCGVFLDNQCFWHSDWQPLHPRFTLRGLVEVSDESARAGFDEKFVDSCKLRLLHGGWEAVEHQGRSNVKWKKASPKGRGELLMDRSFTIPKYALALGDKNSTVQTFAAEWADWGRLVVTQRGRVLTGKYNRHTSLCFEELADFNGNLPESIEAPEWAKRW